MALRGALLARGAVVSSGCAFTPPECHFSRNVRPPQFPHAGDKTSNFILSPPRLAFQLSQSRLFAVKRVVQKRRHAMKLLHLKQGRFEPKPHDYQPLPLSLLGSGAVRRLVNAGTQEALEVASTIDWEKYKSDTRGVRWHPNGSWRVQFDRRNYENNFFVKCDCYFRVSLYGFEEARRLAIAYRRRLEVEWDELERTWERLGNFGKGSLPSGSVKALVGSGDRVEGSNASAAKGSSVSDGGKPHHH